MSPIAYSRIASAASGQVRLAGSVCFIPDADLDPPTTQIRCRPKCSGSPARRSRPSCLFGSRQMEIHVLRSAPVFLAYRWGRTGVLLQAATSASPSTTCVPGEHTFEVRAMDRNGNIDPHPAGYRFLSSRPGIRPQGFGTWRAASVLIDRRFVRTCVLQLPSVDAGRSSLSTIATDPRNDRAAGTAPENFTAGRAAIAENQPGAIGAAIQYGDGVLQYFPAFSARSVQMTYAAGSVGRRRPRRAALSLASLGFGAWIDDVQIRSGKQEILGRDGRDLSWPRRGKPGRGCLTAGSLGGSARRRY